MSGLKEVSGTDLADTFLFGISEYQLMADLLLSIAEKNRISTLLTILKIQKQLIPIYDSLIGQTAIDEAQAQFEHDDFVASVNFAGSH